MLLLTLFPSVSRVSGSFRVLLRALVVPACDDHPRPPLGVMRLLWRSADRSRSVKKKKNPIVCNERASMRYMHADHPPRPVPSGQSSSCVFASLPTALYLHLAVFRRFWAVRTLCIAVILIHVAEGLYVFRLAQRVGHKDTAPLWLIQTTILGFPSTLLARQLML